MRGVKLGRMRTDTEDYSYLSTTDSSILDSYLLDGGNPIQHDNGAANAEKIKAADEAILHEMGYCFTPDTMLLQADGQSIRAEDVTLGSWLLDEHGVPTQVIDLDRGYHQSNAHNYRQPRSDRPARNMYQFTLYPATLADASPFTESLPLAPLIVTNNHIIELISHWAPRIEPHDPCTVWQWKIDRHTNLPAWTSRSYPTAMLARAALLFHTTRFQGFTWSPLAETYYNWLCQTKCSRTRGAFQMYQPSAVSRYQSNKAAITPLQFQQSRPSESFAATVNEFAQACDAAVNPEIAWLLGAHTATLLASSVTACSTQTELLSAHIASISSHLPQLPSFASLDELTNQEWFRQLAAQFQLVAPLTAMPLHLLTDTIAVRQAFLAGIFDAMGSEIVHNAATAFALRVEQELAAEIVLHLARGLGLAPRRTSPDSNGIITIYISGVTPSMLPFANPSMKQAVQQLSSAETWCYTVEAPAKTTAGGPSFVQLPATHVYCGITVSGGKVLRADSLIVHNSQELHRGFSSFMNFSFCFTAVAIISSMSVLFNYGLNTGGPAVMIWGWIVGAFFTCLIGLSMGEIAATYPSAGSVYHWAGQLSSAEWAPFSSFICGWFNFLGNAAGDASYAFGCSQMIAAAVALNHASDNPDSVPLSSIESQVLLSIGIAALWAIKNCARVDHQGWFNNFSALFQMFSTVVIVLSLFIAAPMRSSSEFVWTSTYNSTGMNSMVYVSLIGLLTTLFSFSGYEAGAHMSEETHNASSSAPWSIVNTCIAASITGFVYLLGLLYAALNVDLVLDGNSAQSVVNIYTQAFTSKLDTTGWNPAVPSTCPDPTCCDVDNPICTLKGPVRYAGATALTSLLIINIFFAGFSSLTVTSRIGFAMVRDGAMPGSKFLYSVEEHTKAPVRMIIFVFLLDALLCLMPLVNTTAFAAITGITTIGYQISYAIPIFLRLTASRKTFVQTKAFNLGRYSEVIGWISVIWLIFTSCLFFFPTQFDDHMQQTAKSFNYTCVVVGGTMLLALTYWFLPEHMGGARWSFIGPKRKDHANEKHPVADNNAGMVHATSIGYAPMSEK